MANRSNISEIEAQVLEAYTTIVGVLSDLDLSDEQREKVDDAVANLAFYLAFSSRSLRHTNPKHLREAARTAAIQALMPKTETRNEPARQSVDKD